MGSSETKYHRSREGSQRNVRSSPYVNCQSFRANSNRNKTTLCEQMNSALACVKVSTYEASKVENQLCSEYFTSWNENCDVQKFYGYGMHELDSLLQSICRSINIPGLNLYSKLSGIRFAEEIEEKIFDFCFGGDLQSGVVHFGTIVLCKRNNSVDAATCLYKLNFEVGRTRVEKTTDHYFMGIHCSEDKDSWYERKSLGCMTQQALTNFCRVKALKEFKAHGLVSRINDQRGLPTS